jgi:hypothetical protein
MAWQGLSGVGQGSNGQGNGGNGDGVGVGQQNNQPQGTEYTLQGMAVLFCLSIWGHSFLDLAYLEFEYGSGIWLRTMGRS